MTFDQILVQVGTAGVLSWKVKVGDIVEEGQLLGEVVDIEDPFAARTPIYTRTAGIVFGMASQKLAIPGDLVIYVSGDKPLAWRTGYLLSA